MVQLSDDSAHGKMLTLDEAVVRLAELAESLAPSRKGTIALRSATGFVLSHELCAKIQVPKRDNSAVDGVAYCLSDLSETGDMGLLPLMPNTVFATSDDEPAPLVPGHAVRIMTGAALPPGADTVCMNEDLAFTDAGVKLPTALKSGSNIRPAGEDFQPGDVIAKAGTNLTPRHVAAAISAGYVLSAEIPVVKSSLRVVVKATGDELGEGDEALVNDCNTPMLSDLFWNWNLDSVLDTKPLPDTLKDVTEFFAKLPEDVDAIITTGGVSTGDRDYLKEGFEAAGGTVDFWRIGIKPGRPVAVGIIGNTLWIGLPGNPVAALVTALEVALPTLRAMSGETLKPLPGFWVRLEDSYKKKAGRREFVRVQVLASTSPDQLPTAKKFHKAGAGMVSGLIWADGLAQIPEDLTRVEPGTAVWFTPWESYRL